MLIVAACCGAGLTAVPLAIATVTMAQKCEVLKRSVTDYEMAWETMETAACVVVANDMKAGETIAKEDLQILEITGDDASEMTGILTQDPVGMCVKIPLKKGAVLQDDVLYTEKLPDADERYLTLADVQWPGDVVPGQRLDLRISYGDGEEYILLAAKEVLWVGEDEEGRTAVRFCMDEEELMMLASARVDRNTYANTRIYAIPYVSEAQNAALVNYPPSQVVFDLLADNDAIRKEILSGQMQQQRQLLEENLQSADLFQGEVATTYSRAELEAMFVS